MRNLVILLGSLFALCQTCFCNPLMDQIEAGFVGNAKLAMEFTSHGSMQYEFLDNVVEIGKLKDEHIAAIDLAILGEQLPDDTVSAVQWGTGIKLHLAPLLKNYVVLAPEWVFLNTLEIDGRYSYNFTTHHPTLGLSIAYPWK